MTFFILVVATCLIGMYLAYSPRPAPPPPASPEAPTATGRQRASYLRINCGLPLPAETEVLRWDNRSGRDTEIWALLRVRPDQVIEVKQALRSFAAAPNRGWTVDDSDANTLQAVGRADADRHPDWWLPAQLPDPDVLLLRQADGIFVVLSVQTGLIYLLRWDV